MISTFVLYAAKNKLTVRDAKSEILTSGSVNVYTVRFQFSAEWDGLTRMAVFKSGSDSRSVLLDDTNQCTIPWEVLLHGRRELSVGVLGSKNGEIVLPTIWVSLGEIRPGTSSAEAAGPPTPSPWEQQLAAKGDALGYTEAGDLGLYSGGKLLKSVKVLSTGDHRELTHRDAEGAHPIEAIANLGRELSKRVTADDALSIVDIIKIMEG